MEIHHHSGHHEKKTWRSYFWEFFMLFLAVTAGFFVENQREHFVEGQREKEYAETLLEDLASDSVELSEGIISWEFMNAHTDTVRSELEKVPAERNLLRMYRNAALLISNKPFNYNDRTIGQLKNAGNFRLIRNREISDSLIQYNTRIAAGLKDLERRYTQIYFENREVLQQQVFNSKFYPLRDNPAALAEAAGREPGVIEPRKGKDDALFQYYNCLFSLRFQTAVRVRNMKSLQVLRGHLAEMIRKEYHK